MKHKKVVKNKVKNKIKMLFCVDFACKALYNHTIGRMPEGKQGK